MGCIEAHVERPGEREREPALGVAELVGREPQIGDDAVHGFVPLFLDVRFHVGERAQHGAQPVAVRRETLPGAPDGFRVAVEREHLTAGGTRTQDRLGVTTAAESRIHVHAAGLGIQKPHDFFQEHRFVRRYVSIQIEFVLRHEPITNRQFPHGNVA